MIYHMRVSLIVVLVHTRMLVRVWCCYHMNCLGTVFNVQWECIYELPFSRPDVARFKNPYNQGYPLKRSRDGTELPPNIGEALCQFMDDGFKLYVSSCIIIDAIIIMCTDMSVWYGM